MKKLLLTAPLALVLGCQIFGTSWQTTAGKFLTTTAITVDGFMHAWATAVVTGVTTPQEESEVRVLYGQYQNSMLVATNAYVLAVKLGDPSLWSPASNNLFVAKDKLATKTSAKSIKP